MEAGQGNVDISFKKPVIKETSVIESPTNDTGVQIIDIAPRITWAKKPVPTLLPQRGLHGGIVFRKHDSKITGSMKKLNNMEIYIPDVGFGAGGYVVCGSGPVLIGADSMGPLTHIFLPWIAIILLITALARAIRHILIHIADRRNSIYSKYKVSRNWVDEVIDRDQKSNSQNLSLLNANATLRMSIEDTKMSLISMPDPPKSTVTSMSQYSASDRYSFMKSKLQNNHKAASTASILSFSSTMIGSVTYEIPTWSQGQMAVKMNQMAIWQSKGVIFTVSEKRCPNAYMREDLNEIKHVYEPSEYNECVEVLLLCDQCILVGRMKNRNVGANDMPFVIQVWSTTNGSVDKNVPDYLLCYAMCSIADEYLVVVSRDQIIVLELRRNTRIAGIQSPLLLHNPQHTSVIMQSTTDMDYIVLSVQSGQSLSFYVYNFDHIHKALSEISTRSYNATTFTQTSSTEMIVASVSSDVILWDFVQDMERPVLISTDQDIQRLMTPPASTHLLLQFNKRISVFEIDKFEHVFDIPVSSDQVCALAFSSNESPNRFLAVALDNGTIQIHDGTNGIFRETLTTDIPITYLMFDEGQLLALSDRASHYQLKVFTLQ